MNFLTQQDFSKPSRSTVPGQGKEGRSMPCQLRRQITALTEQLGRGTLRTCQSSAISLASPLCGNQLPNIPSPWQPPTLLGGPLTSPPQAPNLLLRVGGGGRGGLEFSWVGSLGIRDLRATLEGSQPRKVCQNPVGQAGEETK